MLTSRLKLRLRDESIFADDDCSFFYGDEIKKMKKMKKSSGCAVGITFHKAQALLPKPRLEKLPPPKIP